ncbi:hypothetical protein [Calothrix sp. FACHB-168]|nr:hypothetical protein [Calothrix sp. FACHB-168]
MPNAPCPMPNAPCPMPNAQCPIPLSIFSISFTYLQHYSSL